MGKKCGITVVVLLAIIAGMGYKFMIQGSVVESSDGRKAIQLDGAERDLVLTEMRTFLSTVQTITVSLSRNDMVAVAAAARAVGNAAQQAVPASLMGKLPMEFKQLGFDTHSRFDQVALDAEQMGDGEYVLQQMGELMRNCVACHEAYRIDPAPAVLRQ